jgi:peptide/nickel transport system substrate-binding protein
MARRTRHRTTALALAAACMLTSGGGAIAQKQGGTLRSYIWDNPPSASIHEEATVSTVFPFMPVFNNVVLFDQAQPTGTLDTIVPDLAKNWVWDATRTKVTFQLEEGVRWHDGKPFTAADVKCTFDLISGLAKSDDFRKNPRKVWYFNVSQITTGGDFEVTFHLKAPQPSFLALLASGYSPVYPCHVPQREMRSRPIGTGPFKVAEFKRNETVTLVRNPEYWKKGKPHLDRIEYRAIDSRSTRVLAFIAGEFDLTFPNDVTYPLLKDIRARRPDAVCNFLPGNNTTNMIVNPTAPPFDNPRLRLAMALALDRSVFNTILAEGQAEARRIMQSLGYSKERPLKVRVSTRNVARYRDPAVIFIDQMKNIFIEGELEVIDTSIWFTRVQRKDYAIGLNGTGVAVDDPDVNLIENYSCRSERNYTGYCNEAVDALIFAQSREIDPEKRKQLVWAAERKIVEDVARPIILHEKTAMCWAPFVKGITRHDNSLYNSWRLEDAWLDR